MKQKWFLLIFIACFSIFSKAEVSFEALLRKAVEATPDSAQSMFDLAQQQIRTKQEKSLYFFYKTRYFATLAKADSVLYYGRKSIVVAKQLKDTVTFLTSYNNVGKTLSKNGLYDAAFQYLFTGLRLSERKDDKIWQGIFLINIGLAYHDFEDYTRGIKYAKQAFARLNSAPESKPFLKVLALNTIAINFDDWNKPDSALTYHFKVLSLKNELDTTAIPFTYNNIGNTYLKQKKYVEAERWLLRAERITEMNKANYAEKEYAYEKATHFTNLTTSAYHQNKTSIAYQYLDSTRKYVGASASIEKRRDLYQLQSQFMEYIGNYKQALFFQSKYVVLRDSIFESERLKSVQESENRYQFEKNERELAEQKAARWLAESEMQKKQIWGFVATLAVFFLVLFILLLVKQHSIRSQQREKEFALREKIIRIESQNELQEQRLYLSRELHDNIGSQLTFIISSVKNIVFRQSTINATLLPQLKNIEKFATETLNELRDTIWITGTEFISFDTLRERFENFIAKNSDAAEGINITLYISPDLKHTRLSSLAGINIYRIVQEAFTNTFKYADATTFDVKVEEIGEEVILKIIDNGCGFDIQSVIKGNGLQNIEKRSSILEGKLQINSMLNQGTEFRITFDINKLVLS